MRFDGRAIVVKGGSPDEKSRPGRTCDTSSFGSCGSFCGVGAAKAAAMFTIPYPVWVLKPDGPTGCAVERRMSATWLTVSVGRAVHNQAAAAATIGAAKLVPESPLETPDASCESGTEAVTSIPGAARSTQSP